MSASEYELSNRIFDLRRMFVEHHSGIVLNDEAVNELTNTLKTLGVAVQKQEHELRRLSAREKVVPLVRRSPSPEIIAAAAQVPGSNVRLVSFEKPFGG